MAVLVIEQNIGVACAVSENVAIMVNGRINRVIEAQRLAADRALQQRLLGVGRHGHDDTPLVRDGGGRRPRRAPAARRPASASTPHLCLESDTADALVAAGAGRQDRGGRANQRGEHRVDRGGGRPPRRDPAARRERPAGRARRRHARYEGRGAAVHPRSAEAAPTCERASSTCPPAASIPRADVAAERSRAAIIRAARRACSPAIAAHRSPRWRRRSRPGSARQSGIAGIISAGGSGATALVTPAMRRLPVGVPKIMISTVASGEVGRYVGAVRHHDDVFGHRRSGPQRRSRAKSWRTARRRSPAW